MSERKVLNKYYPPDFDPSKIPRARQSKNRQFTVRLMAPCNMRCNTCGEYIYKGKKFNARKEDVENEDYLGIRIYRFYIKCTRCLQEISFKTDPASTDYVIEAGASRNFMALKLAEEQAEREEQAVKEDEATNPMKLLEKRTEASKHEMAVLEALEELKELNSRMVNPDYDTMLGKFSDIRDAKAKVIEDEEDEYIESIFGKNGQVIRRIEDEDSDEEGMGPPKKKFSLSQPTSILTSEVKPDVKPDLSGKQPLEKEKSIGMLSVNRKNLVLVKPKHSSTATATTTTTSAVTVKQESYAGTVPIVVSGTGSGSKPLGTKGPLDKSNGSVGLLGLGAYSSDSASESD